MRALSHRCSGADSLLFLGERSRSAHASEGCECAGPGGVLVAIWCLTAQQTEGSAALSGAVARLLARWEAEVSGASFPGAGVAVQVLAFAQTHTRKLAHTAEFLALGLSVGVALLAWSRPTRRLRWLVLAGVGSCAFFSVADQAHKIFVPVRHFDVTDFPYDVAGYGGGLLLTLGVAALLRRRRRA